jgi:hypothetical protein
MGLRKNYFLINLSYTFNDTKERCIVSIGDDPIEQ